MTARDVIADGDVLRLRSLLAESVTLRLHPATYAAIERAIARLESTLAQPSGEAVAWQEDMPGLPLKWSLGAYVIEYSGAEDEPYYAAFSADDHLGDHDTLEAAQAACYVHARQHYSVLFTTPPAPLGGLTGPERAALERAAEALTDTGERSDSIYAIALHSLARRLTAPRAEGVDGVPDELNTNDPRIPHSLAVAHIAFRDGWNACREAALTAAAPKVAAPQADAVADSIGQWATALADVDANEGRWATCSGCYESVEGYPAPGYPFSAMLGCTLGAGCHECGGLGAVWDQADYAALADAAAPQAEAGEVERLRTDAHELRRQGQHTAAQLQDELADSLAAQPAAQGGDGGEKC